MTRIGQNPAKFVKDVAKPARITVAVLNYIPFLSGFYVIFLFFGFICIFIFFFGIFFLFSFFSFSTCRLFIN